MGRWYVIEDLNANNSRLLSDAVSLAGNSTSAMSAVARYVLVANCLALNKLRSTNGSSFEVHMLMVDSGVNDVGDGSFAGGFVIILELVLGCARQLRPGRQSTETPRRIRLNVTVPVQLHWPYSIYLG